MVNANTMRCPSCGGKLKYYDHAHRIVRSKGRKSKWIEIERTQCTKCGKTHRIIPSYIVPYKQYEREIIIGVMQGYITPDKQSETDNAIASLKKKYQGYVDEEGNEKGGASTLISRAKSETRVLKTKGTPKINPETGELEYKTVTETYVDKNGKTQTRMQTSTQMADTKDARTLSSGTPQEEAYARYANSMKALANKARKTYLTTQEISRDSNAEKVYATEVATLNSKLTEAKKNAPKERQAQLKANAEVKAKVQDNPNMTKEDKKKASSQALARARVSVGAKRSPIDITDKEWEAIQAGAISKSKLSEILKYTDTDKLKERAMPRSSNSQLSTAKQNRIKRMINSGYSIADVADAMGISTSTVRKYM